MLKRPLFALVVLICACLPAAADAPKMLKEFNGHGGPITAVAIHPQGKQLSFGTTRGTLRVRSLNADNDTNLLNTAGWLAYSPIVVAANPNGVPLGTPSLLTLAPDGRLTIWYPDNFQRQGYSEGAGINGALSYNGRVLACTYGKIDIHIWPMNHWDPSYHAIIMSKPDFDGRVTTLALNHNGSLMASGYLVSDGSGRVLVWDRPVGKVINSIKLDQAPGTVVYSPKGTHLAAVGRAADGKGVISLWKPRRDEQTVTLPAPPSPVLSAEFSPDEKLLATGRIDGTVDIWDVASQKVVSTMPAHKGPVRAVTWHRNGKVVASGGEDGFVRLWQLPKK